VILLSLEWYRTAGTCAGQRGEAVAKSVIRLFTLALALVVVMTSLACGGERDRMKLR
jgi:hypothetical protein